MVATQGSHLVPRPSTPALPPSYDAALAESLDDKLAWLIHEQALRCRLYGTTDAEDSPISHTPPSVRQRYLEDKERSLQELWDSVTPSENDSPGQDVGCRRKAGLLTPDSGSCGCREEKAAAVHEETESSIAKQLPCSSHILSPSSKELPLDQHPIRWKASTSVSVVEERLRDDRLVEDIAADAADHLVCGPPATVDSTKQASRQLRKRSLSQVEKLCTSDRPCRQRQVVPDGNILAPASSTAPA